MTAINNGCHAAFLQLPTTSSQDGHRPRKFSNSALTKDFGCKHRDKRSLSHTSVEPISSKQSLRPDQLNLSALGPPLCSVIFSSSHSVHWALENSRLLLAMFAKGLALAGIGTPLEVDPFSESNYVTSPSKG